MTIQILQALGGLGLFLVGMNMLTEGLRGLAGDQLRTILRRSTDTPLKGATAGALTTAMVQSSSATTVATVGFVAAGLMTFQQALGVIFGANIGTTVTGWLVAIVGFKLDLGLVLMPVVLGGALMQMFAPNPWKQAGWALAGFGVLFIGIDALKDGMVAFRGIVTPDSFPADTLIGRLKLVVLGIVLTVITQSSSAGVASALAALAVGAITFPQAAALVIGMNVGTTFTAMIATLGGGTATRRTGVSHVIFNLLTGCMAFALLYPIGWALQRSWGAAMVADPQIALVAFHTFFNFLGVAAVLGITSQFARLIIWIVPDRGTPLTRNLGQQLLTDKAAALDAANAATHRITAEFLTHLGRNLNHPAEAISSEFLDQISVATRETQGFVEAISTDNETAEQVNQQALLHIFDHLDRLRHRAMQRERIATSIEDSSLRERGLKLGVLMRGYADSREIARYAAQADMLRRDFRDFRERHRAEQIRLVASHARNPENLSLILDSSRWLQRSAYHLWRIADLLRQIEGKEPHPETHEQILSEETD
ncbi:Na/Pi-cotransporter II-related protein [Thalassovita gelatinovora]|uniref:Na/Pi-cotransporter II-related protein n=1 Tax=Thalassovita gelatinovora TaxID=53501 RepID=A0A0P1G405_THAGE|nr:Na/Pi symporter [Thalassovita gelatinovora]QIZ82345.1 Na/Pi cotransporter family protein [Thalassovita gelatinovora]CUH68413.1 Na/Pi-cotransporter II-related protein [Thalassovita gelatinovora]SEQ51451.1 phosphate:Na+ symporter [Thalassovita gelatinovora]